MSRLLRRVLTEKIGFVWSKNFKQHDRHIHEAMTAGIRQIPIIKVSVDQVNGLTYTIDTPTRPPFDDVLYDFGIGVLQLGYTDVLGTCFRMIFADDRTLAATPVIFLGRDESGRVTLSSCFLEEDQETMGLTEPGFIKTLKSNADFIMGVHVLLECSNVYLEDVSPTKAQQRKHRKRHNYPLIEYKELRVRTEHKHYIKEDSQEPRHRASPRQHLCRGHVRHCHSGVKTFVRAHLKGDPSKGKVVKTYQIG